jgi:hypothetical protein
MPHELLEKLAALIPRPYVNLIVYHGVLAPNAHWRGEVLDFGRAKVESEPSASSPRKVTGSYNRTWAELMRRGLDIDVLQCPTAAAACGSWPPSCFRPPFSESSAISVSPQHQSSSRLRGHPPSSTMPGLVECARP